MVVPRVVSPTETPTMSPRVNTLLTMGRPYSEVFMASASRWSAAGLWVRVENNRLSVSVTVRRMAWVKVCPR